MANLKKVFTILFIIICSFIMVSCKEDDNNKSSYDGKVFDISVSQDKSLIATSKKIDFYYELTISGSGEAKSYSKKELVPWNAISNKISKVTIEEGIKNIGNYYFYSSSLDKYIIPQSVEKIEENSFNKDAVIYSYSSTPIEENCDNKVYYYSETNKLGSDQYWHMVSGLPVVWKRYKILFIGNSFTYYPFSENNPAVAAITNSIAKDLGLNVVIEGVIKGAHSLRRFADPNDEKGKIVHEKLNSSNDYDYVILQEHSTTPVNAYDNFKKGVELIVNKVKSTQENCEVVLYATWGFEEGLNSSKFTSVEVMEGLIREAYITCAQEYGLKVSHVGKAFTYVYKNYKDINLYWSDKKHQNYAGSYLSACVHICTLFNIDVRNSSFIGELNAEDANILRNVAYEMTLK